MVNRPGKPGPFEAPSPTPAPPAAPAARLDAVFGALGCDVRRVLLDRLARGPLAVADLAAAVTVSGPAVSKHLRVLEEAGLIRRAREGRVHRIAREDAGLHEAAGWLAGQGIGAGASIQPAPAAPLTAPPAATPARAGAAPPEVPQVPHALALVRALAPARAVIDRALDARSAAPVEGPADYLAHVLRRRLGTNALRAELADGLAALRGLEGALEAGEPAAAALEDLTAGVSRLTWLLGQHPALADLGLLARRPPAA